MFEGCLTGPEEGVDPGCDCTDMDFNGEVTLEDFSAFQNLYVF